MNANVDHGEKGGSHFLGADTKSDKSQNGKLGNCEIFDEDYLFPLNILQHEMHSDQSLITRPLHFEDYGKGYCDLLSQLTSLENMDKTKFQERFREFQKAKDTYYIVVIEDLKRKWIVGTATLFVEKKIIHGAGKVGHIEDVVIDSSYRGKDLGKRLIEQLKCLGEKISCYKIILDCSEKNVTFYEKCGFTKKEIQMVFYRNHRSNL